MAIGTLDTRSTLARQPLQVTITIRNAKNDIDFDSATLRRAFNAKL